MTPTGQKRVAFAAVHGHARSVRFGHFQVHDPRRFLLSSHHAVVYFFAAAYDAGRSRDFRGATAANVPSAGMTLYQTDFAFLPVQPTTSSSGWKLTTHVRRPSRLRERRPVPWSWLLGDGCHLNHSIGASSPRQGLDRRANFLESALSS